MKSSSIGQVSHLIELRRWIDDDLEALREAQENERIVNSLAFLGDYEALPSVLQTQVGAMGGARRWIDEGLQARYAAEIAKLTISFLEQDKEAGRQRLHVLGVEIDDE